MIQKNTVRLLRLPFSFFLMPVFWFAFGQVVDKDWRHAVIVFFILHVLVYPASNGYNSYMDRDTTPIGGLEHPPQPTPELFRLVAVMDILAILLGLLISPWFTIGLAVYILASRAYSYRKIRLKKYPVPGYLTVVLCQGALVFALVYHGCHSGQTFDVPVGGMLASSLLIGGFYPLTQIYQHEADRRDGVRTLSMLLGLNGTFIYSAILYTFAFLVLGYFLLSNLEITEFKVVATSMLPILVYFIIWALKVRKDPGQANFSHTMRMNLLASICTNAGFIAILFIA